MKVFSYSLVFPIVYGALIEPRAAQFGGLGSLFGKSSKDNASGKPIKIENVKPRIRSSAKRQFIRYGPIQLAASKVSPLSNLVHSYRSFRMAEHLLEAIRTGVAVEEVQKALQWTQMALHSP